MVMAALAMTSLMTLSSISVIPEAYKEIANKHRIPVEVLYAVMLQESGMTKGGKFIPWPWTLNVAHKAYRFETREEAETALAEHLLSEKPIAVGLGQIYLPAHGHLFDDPITLLSPRENLEYAASLLVDEFEYLTKIKNPNWWLAAGRYHHPSNETFAKQYRVMVFLKCRKISTQCHMYGSIQ